jgi:DNA polymerase V
MDPNALVAKNPVTTPKNNQLAVIVKQDAFQIERIDANSKEEIQLWGVITYVIKSVL